MLLLSREDIKSVITMKDIIEADKKAFKMVVDGTVDTPLRTVAVSYTHLDVYKRQACICSVRRRITGSQQFRQHL